MAKLLGAQGSRIGLFWAGQRPPKSAQCEWPGRTATSWRPTRTRRPKTTTCLPDHKQCGSLNPTPPGEKGEGAGSREPQSTEQFPERACKREATEGAEPSSPPAGPKSWQARRAPRWRSPPSAHPRQQMQPRLLWGHGNLLLNGCKSFPLFLPRNPNPGLWPAGPRPRCLPRLQLPLRFCPTGLLCERHTCQVLSASRLMCMFLCQELPPC